MNHTRRHFLSSLAILPWAGPFACRDRAGQPFPCRRRARALIVVWLDGGLSHLDAFDGKPEAAANVRGDGRWQRIEGEQDVWLSDHLPELGKRLGRTALIRSLTHGEGNHDRGAHLMLTGHRPSPVLVHPALGAALAVAAGSDDPLPAYVAIPTVPAYGGAGFLPATRGPFPTGGDPAKPGFRIADLAARADAAAIDALVDQLDRLDGRPRSPAEGERDRFARAARAMANDPQLRELFALDREAPKWRERFGRHRLGQSCLLAARLCRGGVPTVLVRDDGWDHHRDVRRELTYGFPGKLTQLDEALRGLLDLLREQQLEDDILVAVLSEFGRTPRLNPEGGRDHWPRAMSALLFGGGIRPGAVVGSTDARGEEPSSDACSPEDLCATLLAARGIDLDTQLATGTGRPIRLLAEGAAPIAAVLRG